MTPKGDNNSSAPEDSGQEEKDTLVAFGARLRSLRGKRSRDEVAIASKISRAGLAKYENATAVPSAYIALRLARYFGVTMEWLLLGEGETKRPDPAAPAVIANLEARIERGREAATQVLNERLAELEKENRELSAELHTLRTGPSNPLYIPVPDDAFASQMGRVVTMAKRGTAEIAWRVLIDLVAIFPRGRTLAQLREVVASQHAMPADGDIRPDLYLLLQHGYLTELVSGETTVYAASEKATTLQSMSRGDQAQHIHAAMWMMMDDIFPACLEERGGYLRTMQIQLPPEDARSTLLEIREYVRALAERFALSEGAGGISLVVGVATQPR